jgi:hypothetical protein
MLKTFLKKCLSFLIGLIFVFTSLTPSAQAQTLMGQLLPLPEPGSRVALSGAYDPPVLRGIKVFTHDPLKFDFILDPGDARRGMMVDGKIDPKAQAELKATSDRLIKYFRLFEVLSG